MNERRESSKTGTLGFDNKYIRDLSVTIIASSLFYWFWRIGSNCRDLTQRDLSSFKFNISNLAKTNYEHLLRLCLTLMDHLKKNKKRKEVYYRTSGQVIYDEYYMKLSKNLIDEIDKTLANHYGFTKELDFIINYDIKYRMGKELEEEE